MSTKDLRDIFNDLTSEAGKKASDVMGKADLPDLSKIGRRNETPGLLWFGIGLTLGAVIGMLAAFLSTPYNGEQARQKLSEQVEKVRKSREDVGSVGTNGSSTYATTPTSAYERS
ncbi:MAG TPA: YtxH domain-containing protein [Candidatus Limnocylindrales bacterium]|nr:YtxH domain-containing protein [Candidatus Limnocylindrales bacterium]